MNRPALAAALVTSCLALAADPQNHDHAPKAEARPAAPAAPAPAPAAAAGTPNVVQREMQALHELTVGALVAIENDKVEGIPELLHKVHGLKQDTEKALASGEWKPAVGGTTKDFIKQDEAFHKLLYKLLDASKKKDVKATTKALATVLEGCTACHLKFKFPAPPPAAKAP